MPKKQAMNAAGQEIRPAVMRRPAPIAAASSSTKVARNKLIAATISEPFIAADDVKRLMNFSSVD
jgi:hypothetical protein